MKLSPDHFKTLTPADALAFEPQAAPAVSPPVPPEHPSAPFISLRVITALAQFAEGCVALLAGLIAAYIYPGPVALSLNYSYLPLIIAVAAGLPVLLRLAGAYSLRSLLNPADTLTTLLAMWSLLFAGVMATLTFTKSGDEFSRLWIMGWFLGGAVVLALTRLAIHALVRRWNSRGQLSRLAVMIGGGEPAHLLQEALNGSATSDVRVIGVFDDRDQNRLLRKEGDLPRLGNVEQLVDFVRKARVDMLLVTLPLGAEDRLLHVLNQLWVLPVDIRLSAQNQKLRYRPRAYSYVGNVPFLDVFDKPLGEWGPLLKAIEDRVIASLLLALSAPLFALIALAIKLDSKGPVFFIQKRFGFNNELIEVYKFRSMRSDMTDHNAERLATRDDPRVTRVGRFLRKTSLDELPQLLNVLNGTLSLVGPRPHATKAKAEDKLYFDIVDGYFARHKVKPGITGWAQVNGWRGETDTREKILKRVEHDLYYIENWSLPFDLYILARTPLALLKNENAY
jgi:Undecaprenyl-phosphate glucose phosphotransferase